MIYQRCGKRLLDLVCSAVGLLVLSPLLGVTSVLIKLTSKGPIFYSQPRVGRSGRIFDAIKFRTMVVGAERLGTGVLVTRNDPRVTRVGRVLRALSIDELPQLFNVLAGRMSLVGPRPALPYQVEQYDARQRRRLELLPGITGWAQVNGRNAIPWDERIRLDLEYLERVSLWFDLKIIFRTIWTVLLREQQFAEREFFKTPPPGVGVNGDSMQPGNTIGRMK